MKLVILTSILTVMPVTARAACDFECQQGLRNWAAYQAGCNALNARFQGHLVVKPKQIDREEFQCEVKSVNWDVLKSQFGLDRIATNAMVVVDKHGREDWQIAPGLTQYVPVTGREPYSPLSVTASRTAAAATWPSLPGETRLPPKDDGDIQPFIVPVLMIGIRVAATVLSAYGGATAFTDFSQKGAKVDDTRKAEYEAAQLYGMETPQYEKAHDERVAAEDSCVHCYNTKFDMFEGNGYHYAGFGLGFHLDEHEPKTYDFVISHYGLGVTYEEK